MELTQCIWEIAKNIPSEYAKLRLVSKEFKKKVDKDGNELYITNRHEKCDVEAFKRIASEKTKGFTLRWTYDAIDGNDDFPLLKLVGAVRRDVERITICLDSIGSFEPMEGIMYLPLLFTNLKHAYVSVDIPFDLSWLIAASKLETLCLKCADYNVPISAILNGKEKLSDLTIINGHCITSRDGQYDFFKNRMDYVNAPFIKNITSLILSMDAECLLEPLNTTYADTIINSLANDFQIQDLRIHIKSGKQAMIVNVEKKSKLKDLTLTQFGVCGVVLKKDMRRVTIVAYETLKIISFNAIEGAFLCSPTSNIEVAYIGVLITPMISVNIKSNIKELHLCDQEGHYYHERNKPNGIQEVYLHTPVYIKDRASMPNDIKNNQKMFIASSPTTLSTWKNWMSTSYQYGLQNTLLDSVVSSKSKNCMVKIKDPSDVLLITLSRRSLRLIENSKFARRLKLVSKDIYKLVSLLRLEFKWTPKGDLNIGFLKDMNTMLVSLNIIISTKQISLLSGFSGIKTFILRIHIEDGESETNGTLDLTNLIPLIQRNGTMIIHIDLNKSHKLVKIPMVDKKIEIHLHNVLNHHRFYPAISFLVTNIASVTFHLSNNNNYDKEFFDCIGFLLVSMDQYSRRYITNGTKEKKPEYGEVLQFLPQDEDGYRKKNVTIYYIHSVWSQKNS